MKHHVTSEVFSPGLRFKTALLLYCPNIFNEYTLEGMIIKRLTVFFGYHNVNSSLPPASVGNISLLTQQELVWHHFAISVCHNNCFRRGQSWYRLWRGAISIVYCRSHCQDPERLWTVRPLHHCVRFFHDNSVWRLYNTGLPWGVRWHAVRLDDRQW